MARIDFTFEDGVLDALAIVEADFCSAAESGTASGSSGADVVSDEDNHGLL